ncbi:glycosyltransferase family 8 protein, partial [Favolaschia claudopus]
SPSSSIPSRRHTERQSGLGRSPLLRNRKLIALAATALSIALFVLLRDLTAVSPRQEWELVAPPSPPPLVNEPTTRTVVATVTHVLTTTLAPLTVTTTVSAPVVTETVSTVSLPEPVAFVLIAWSEDAAAEAALLIKSILIYNSSPSEFHIICDETAEVFLRARLELVKRPRHPLKIRFYLPSWQSMLDRIGREGSIMTDHSAGVPGLMKLFLHEILPPTVKKAIYIDTDALLIADPTLMWKIWDTAKPSTAFIMASHSDQNAEEWHHASRICSCVMMLNLEKFRQLRLMDSSIYRNDTSGLFPAALAPSAFRAMYGAPTGERGRYDNVQLGDQGFWWAIVDHNRDLFEHLSFDFEEGTLVLPKLLHFNCLHGTARYMDWPGWNDPDNYLPSDGHL